MKTKIDINYYEGFDIDSFGDKLRELSETKDREWVYDEISFFDHGEGNGEIMISYISKYGFPHANLIMSEIDLIKNPHIKVKRISDER